MENNEFHHGHRERIKDKLRKSSLDSFHDHEVMELLLYFGIPVKNTNEIAHALLNRFGSLSGVLDAEYDELIKIKGIGKNAATLITLMTPLFKRYSEDKMKKTRVYKDSDALGEYVLTHFIGAVTEHVELLLFDATGRMIDHVTVSNGALSSSSVNAELLGQYVFSSKATSFLIAHNHPGGRLEPTEEDLIVTRELYRAFKLMNKYMLGHFLVCGERYIDILDAALDMYDN